MTFRIGQHFSNSRLVTDELVRAFADLSGDHNPLHLDDQYAKTTRFGRRIAHGMLSGAFISALIGTRLSEEKIVYLSQTMRFVAPVFIGDTITTAAEVTAIREGRGIVTLSVTCTNQHGTTTLTGESVIMQLNDGKE